MQLNKRLKFEVISNDKGNIEVKIYTLKSGEWKEIEPEFKVFDTYKHNFDDVLEGAVLSAYPKMLIRCKPIKHNRVMVGAQTNNRFIDVMEFENIYPLNPNREELKNLLALLTKLKTKASEIKAEFKNKKD